MTFKIAFGEICFEDDTHGTDSGQCVVVGFSISDGWLRSSHVLLFAVYVVVKFFSLVSYRKRL
jgi:hypothetical protein